MLKRMFFRKLRNLKISGYQLMVIYDMSSIGGKGVKPATLHFDSEEDMLIESERHQVGAWEDFEGIRTRVHDKWLVTSYDNR